MINTTLRMIFTEDEIHRLTITEYKNKKAHIIVDVHGMKCSQVRRFINNIINSVRTAFQLMISRYRQEVQSQHSLHKQIR